MITAPPTITSEIVALVLKRTLFPHLFLKNGSTTNKARRKEGVNIKIRGKKNQNTHLLFFFIYT
ncbi:hypothetical protein GvMRE_IIg245 [endosymbiont GvMRE of Glomus versiforme]|nr:hypothetical protein GvMRE_IIg245 [endosymbiont GvMRE of Glomus versiforme]